MIHRHGDLERLVRDEAARWGWRANVRDIDLDVVATARRGARVLSPGSGTVELSRGGEKTVFEYRLPEDEEALRREVHAALRGADLETQRLVDPHKDRPLIAGGF